MRRVRCRRCSRLLTEDEAVSCYAECLTCREASAVNPDPIGSSEDAVEIVLEPHCPLEPRSVCARCGQPWGRGGRIGDVCARCDHVELQKARASEPLFKVTFQDGTVEEVHALDILQAENIAQRLGNVERIKAVPPGSRGRPTRG